MKRILFAAVAGTSLLSWAAAPVVREGSVKLYRPNGRNIVYVDYILDGAPAVITAEIYSQGTALGLARSSSVSGMPKWVNTARLTASGSTSVFAV